jgi:hypothetical protein
MIQNANDKVTYMTDLEKCLNKLDAQGYTDQYRVENGHLRCLTTNRRFSPDDVKAVNFYRFEGPSNPDDMSILFAVETKDGRKGTLVDAYGLYADKETGEFMKAVEVHKRVHDVHVY